MPLTSVIAPAGRGVNPCRTSGERPATILLPNSVAEAGTERDDKSHGDAGRLDNQGVSGIGRDEGRRQ